MTISYITDMDSHLIITDKDIPRLVDTLKGIMGIKIIPSSSHCLYEHFVDYEASGSVLKNLLKVSPKIFDLARYGSYLEHFRKDWSDPRVLLHLRGRLKDSPQSTVLGVMFEFQAAFHFRFMHRNVSWSPNSSNESEFDIIVVTHSHCEVLIECTRRQPKIERLNNPELLINDVDLSVKSKLKQAAFKQNRAWVCVLIPEDIRWKEWSHCKQLQARMKDNFDSKSGVNLLGVIIVSYRYPRVNIVGKELKVFEDDFPVWWLRNETLRDHIPHDFHPGLPLNQ